MKPFGVRLAFGAVTILLGALAAAQAQKDQQNKAQSEWTVAQVPTLDEPPTPIPAMSAADRSDQSGVPELESDVESELDSNPIQLVQHTQPTSDAPQGISANVTVTSGDANSASESPKLGFHMVDSETGQPVASSQPAASAGPSFGMPDQLPTNSASQNTTPPTMTMTLPQETSAIGVPPSDETQSARSNVAGVSMPELQFEQPPGMSPEANIRESGGPANDLRAAPFSGNEVAGNEFPGTEAISAQSYPAATAEMNASGHEFGAPQNDPSGSFNGSPQALLRTVSSPNLSANDPAASLPEGAPGPQLSQPRFVNPVPQPESQPTLRYAQTPDSVAPNQYSGATYSGDTYSGATPQDPTTGNQATFGGYPQPVAAEAPAARIASLPESQTGYPPRRIDGPVAAAPIQADRGATIATPGDRRLEGIQSPSVVIHKRAPSEVKVGKPASFVIHVQNVGSAEALGVTVHDRIPSGMRLVDASPSPILQGDSLVWELGAMSVGDERTLTLQLVPEQEGELGSVARVTFEAAASVRTISTRPELKIIQKAPPKVLIGQQLEIELEVSNPGTGAATGVTLQEDVPQGLEHPKGQQLDNVLGTLAAGEIRRQVLRLRAVAPGVIQNQIRLTGDDGLEAIDTIEVEVIAPKLEVVLNGPQRRFLERQATYQLDIANVGTADATNVEIAAHLDRGFTFVSTDYEGQYDPSQHTVYWSLANLPQGGNGSVPLTLLPVEEGEQAIRLEARADLGVVAKNERTVAVDSLAELTFSINDVSDPIEVGGETVYEIRLSNSGSRNDSNVRVQLQLPSGMSLLGADGDAQEDGRGGVFFKPRSQLAANDEVVYRIRAQGVVAGTHLVKAIVTSDQSTTPVTKEESTMVYADR